MDPIQVLIEAFPWLEGAVDAVRVTVTATPLYGTIATSTFLILVVGAGYLLHKTGVIRLGGNKWHDDNW